MSIVSVPTTGAYAAWVSWLEAFRRGENPPTDRLGPISGHLGSYVEARLLDRLSMAFAERVRQWQGALADRIVAHPPTGPAEASAFMREAMVRLDPLSRLAGSPLLPRSLGASMHTVLADVREGARAALDEAWRRQAEATASSADGRLGGARAVTVVADMPRPRTPGGAGRGIPRLSQEAAPRDGAIPAQALTPRPQPLG